MASYITEPFGGNMGETAIPMCRISYAQGLWKINDDEKFAVTMIFPNADIGLLQKKVAEVVTNEWGEKGIDRFKNGLIKNPILAGDSKSARDKKTGELHKGMGPDVKFIRPWTKQQPPVFGADGLPMDAKDIKSGWWGYPVLSAFAWHNAEQGDGVGFWINAWMHAKEDEVLGGGGSVDTSKFFKAEAVSTSEDNSSMADAGGMFD